MEEEDVDEEEYEEEYEEEEFYVPASRFPSGWQPMRMCRGFLAGGLGTACTVRGARSLIIGVNCTLGCVSQGHTDPGVRGRAFDDG